VVTEGLAIGLVELVDERPVNGYQIACEVPEVVNVILPPVQMKAESPALTWIALPPETMTTTVSVI